MFFLVINCGSCNEGDHETGIEEFTTLQLAEQRIADLKKRNIYGNARIINGESVEEHDW